MTKTNSPSWLPATLALGSLALAALGSTGCQGTYAGQTLPSPRGWEIRYNAALALARKGHVDLPFDTFVEMLDEERQMVNFSVCAAGGHMAADEAAARRTVYNALGALTQWHGHPERAKKSKAQNAELLKQKYEAGLEKVTRAVEQLTQSANPALRTEALKTLQVLRQP